ncbi:protein BatD [Glaciecola sp. MH2013]|uniref:BatD family protein n=1 Tax=Glaciecola sp. MH2013 TaxID=2785524 RepID=UPI00189FF974|nr:BatD family protein [Glaciecola sp. MH2013]MBF7073271.1 protein BatD [Glaciecola sp. MH2013]
MKYNIRLLGSLVAFFTLVMSPSIHAQVTDLRVSVDKNPMLIDEAVQLIVTAQGSPSSNQLDLSMLEKDFRLSSTSVSQASRSINFQTTKTTTWVTQLFPKTTGTFTIPSLTVDGKTSDPIRLRVLPVSAAQGAAPRDFFITAEVDMDEVYLQQQIKYTAKLFMRQNIQRGSIQAPELADAIIKQVGEDKEYEDLKDGVRYRVIERTFAIIPQQSGAFTIDGVVFQGEVVTDSRQSFGFISRTKPINRISPNIALTVLPIPEDYQAHWLPSEFVELSEEWQKQPSEFIVGQPITRTITLTAAGLVEEQLPELQSVYPPDFKTYPDQAKTVTVDRNGMLFAQKVQSEAIIPNRPGTFVIGETKVAWFNVVTKQTEYAVLPARSVTVKAADGNSQDSTTAISDSNIKPSSVDTIPIKNTTSPTQVKGLDWLHITLALLWLATVVVFALVLFKDKSARPQKQINPTPETNEQKLWLQVRKSISLGNHQHTNQLLKEWLGILGGHKVQSINQALSAMKADKAAAAFNQWVNSFYGENGLAHKGSVQQGGGQQDSAQQVLISALEDYRNQALASLREKQTNIQLYPSS